MDDEFKQVSTERRLGIERRSIVYSACIPERRSGRDNRFCEGHKANNKDDELTIQKT